MKMNPISCNDSPFFVGPFRNAFSLVELMIVISIIGILATVAIPGFSKYKEKAKIVQVTILHSEFVDRQRINLDKYRSFLNLNTVDSKDLVNAGLGHSSNSFGKAIDGSAYSGTWEVDGISAPRGYSAHTGNLFHIVLDESWSTLCQVSMPFASLGISPTASGHYDWMVTHSLVDFKGPHTFDHEDGYTLFVSIAVASEDTQSQIQSSPLLRMEVCE